MKVLRWSLLIMTAIFVPALASAQNAPKPMEHEYFDFVRFGPGVQQDGLNRNNVVGPYTGRFLRNPSSEIGLPTASFSVYCVDFAGIIGDGMVQTASIVDGDLTGTRAFGNLGAGTQAGLTQAAYLSSLFYSWASFAPTGFTQNQAWSALHAAIWDVSGSRSIGETVSSIEVAQLAMDLKARDFSNFNANGWYVLTPKEGGQEVLIRVPEPSTYVMLGTGFLFLFGVTRRRFSENQSAA
jgi:hypothetical protein